MAVDVVEEDAVSLGVGVNVGCVVEEGVRSNVASGDGDGGTVSLSVGVCSGYGVEVGVGVSLATGEGVGSAVMVSPGV